jgi:hypothetical protein
LQFKKRFEPRFPTYKIMRKNIGTSSIVYAAFAALVFVAFAIVAPAQVVLQADFTGTGSSTGTIGLPTGSTGNIATFGDTGSLANGTGFTSSIATPPTGWLPGASGTLQITGTGTGPAGATLTPSSQANSFNSWYSTGSSFVSVNGAIDSSCRTVRIPRPGAPGRICGRSISAAVPTACG